MTLRINSIWSGGQTGADRGALDAAREAGVPIGGYVPNGWRTEDGGGAVKWGRLYPELVELDSSSYLKRTRKNVTETDATIIVIGGDRLESHSGSTQTASMARWDGRPFYVSTGEDVQNVVLWLKRYLSDVSDDNGGIRLNIAGPRESGQPGIYDKTRGFVTALIKRVNGDDEDSAEDK